jgi:hypothetical protein
MGLTTQGREWVIDRLQNVEVPAGSLMRFLGWGTGIAAEAVGDTQLATEASEARVTGTLSQPNATTDRVVGTITADDPKTITEVGRFNMATKGGANQQMLQRHVWNPGIPLVANDQIQFTLDLTD